MVQHCALPDDLFILRGNNNVVNAKSQFEDRVVCKCRKIVRLVWAFIFIMFLFLCCDARVKICVPISFLPPSPIACRTGGREDWTVKGDDPSFSPSLSPFRSASLLLSQHYKA